MAYDNRNAAYDLSLFDEEAAYSTAVPKRREQKVHKKQTKAKKTSKVVRRW